MTEKTASAAPKRSRLGALLLAAQFSDDFVKLVPKAWRRRRGYLLAVDDPNILTLVTKDFEAQAEFRQSVLATNLPLAFLAANLGDDADEELLLDDDVRSTMVGPGFHRHRAYPEVALCCQSIDASATSLNSVGLSKFLNRFALVGWSSMEQLHAYVASLEQKAVKPAQLRRYICRDGNSWSRDAVPVRPARTVFLGPLWQEIVDDVTEFLSEETQRFYVDHGIPYVRTYLLYGHPGNGKTSCIKALASELKLNLYSLNLASSKLDDNGLVDMVHGVMKRSLVAIEDVDRVFNHHTQNETASTVSFSTMLNVMDGILTKDGVIFVLTCNHKDQLDDAFHRCGRIHREFQFSDATPQVAQDMFLSFYPGQDGPAQQFGKKVKNKRNLPVSALQEFFVKHRKWSADAVVGDGADESMLASRRKKDQQGAMVL